MMRLPPARRHTRLVLRLALLCALFSWQAQGAPDSVSFHIPAKPLADALTDFALQAKISIGYAGVDFQDAVSNPVDGVLPPDEALKRVLAGTGYEAVTIDADTIRIRQIASNPLAPSNRAAIEEIVVTTTRRVEVAQSLPYSIAVVTGQDMSDFGAHTSNDLTARVAALSATNYGPGQNMLSIRGLSDSFIAGRTQSMVGLYLDESRLTDDAADPDLRLVDIDRVEVVRGPQGTLYGAGTLGGLVRIITNKPQLDHVAGITTLSAATSEYGGPTGGIDSVLNLPIVPGVLGIRAVGYAHRDGGFIDDTRLGLSHTNQTNIDGGRLALLWRLSDDWSASAGLTNQLIQASDSNYYQGGLPFLSRANYFTEPRRDQFLQTNLTVEGSLDWATVTNTTAFTKRAITGRYDASLAWPVLTGYPIGPATSRFYRRLETITEEARLVSTDEGRFSWTLGGFLSHRDEAFQTKLKGPNAIPQPVIARSRHRDDYANEAALFGEATYRLTDSLSITAGARVFYASLTSAGQVDQPTSGESAAAQGANHTTGFIPKVIVSYQPTDQLTLYVDAAEGFRLGGVNIYSPPGALNVNDGQPLTSQASAFASDRLWTYELGAKTEFLGGRLVANGAAYFTIWDNIQSDQILRTGSLFTANAGDTHAPGLEVDLSFQATGRLRIQANAFWTNAATLDSNPILIQTKGHLPAVPSDNFGISGRYKFLLTDGWDGFATLEYAYVGPETLGFDVNSPRMGDYSTVNVRWSVVHGPLQATLYVRNLMDERANIYAYGNPFSFGLISQITPLRPRTVGIDVSYSY
jgi:outer membrane receptor protein involved in Fe transport